MGNEKSQESEPPVVADTTARPTAGELGKAGTLGKAGRANLMVMALLGLDVFFGAAIGLTGFYVLESNGIAFAGAFVATGGLVLMLIFQLFGRERQDPERARSG